MKKYDVIFVVLTYKAYQDLNEFCLSLNGFKFTYKIIVIDAFFSEELSNKIKEISNKNNCIYLQIENKGYSYGNNYGIDYAVKNFDYKYIIVSNPDIVLKKFDINLLDSSAAIQGPKIITKNKKNQNPFRSHSFSFGEYVSYIGFKKNIKLFVWFNIIINKLLRYIYLINCCHSQKVYALHGSFLIFNKKTIEKYNPIFENKMFLFAEEDYLAYRMKKNKETIIYNEAIEVFHKEDGSVGISNINVNGITKDSYIYYYENYVLK